MNKILVILLLITLGFSCVNQVDSKKININDKVDDDQLQSSEVQFKIKIDSATIEDWDDLGNNLNTVKNITILHDTLEEIPISLGLFPNLESLRLYSCNYKELPQSIGNLKLLKELFLDYTDITSLPDEISTLKSLEKLIINKHDCHKISSCEFEIGKWIGNLNNLREVRFYDCDIEKIPNEIENSKNINSLIFMHSNFLEFPKEILELDSLKHLVIVNSKKLKIPKKFKNRKNLFIDGTFEE